MKKPVIGITLDLAQDNQKYSYAPRPWYALRQDYADSVEAHGATAIMLPYTKDIDSILNMVNGIIISGGDEDVNPRFYGQTIKSSRVKTNDKRAEFELSLVNKAIEKDIPILGICNGMQVINVALGGTLIQDIPEYFNTHINHEQPAPKHEVSHLIHIEKNTLLAKLSDTYEVMVNTTHHQAVDELGRELIISAKASDGIIEAIESKNHRFLVGVQWHSEYLNSKLDSELFKRLVEESSKFV